MWPNIQLYYQFFSFEGKSRLDALNASAILTIHGWLSLHKS